MRICQKCGSPDNGTGICSNCGSTAFREITPTNNNGQNNYSNVQRQVPNGYQNNYGRYSAQQTPNYVAQNGASYGYGVQTPGFHNVGAGAGAAVVSGIKSRIYENNYIVIDCPCCNGFGYIRYGCSRKK